MHGQIANLVKNDEAETIDLHYILDFLLRRWLVIAVTALAVVVLTVVVAFTLTPKYTSTAVVFLDPASQKNLGVNFPGADEQADAAMVSSQIAILDSLNFQKRVVEREKLGSQAAPAAPSFSLTGWIGGLFDGSGSEDDVANVGLEGAGADTAGFSPEIQAGISQLREAMRVSQVGRGPIMQISMTTVNPELSARLANAVADAYIVDQLENRYEAARRASTWLTDRLQNLREQLRISEEAVAKFRAENNLVAVNSKTLNEQQLSEINAELVQIQTEAAAKLAKYEQAQQLIASGGKVEAIPDVMQSPVISDLRAKLASTAAREADLASRYGERHPMVVNVRAERGQYDRMISAEIQRVIANLKNDYDVAKTRADAMAANVAAVSGQATAESSLTIRLRELERDASANRTLYETFLQQAKLTSEQSEMNIQDARIITPALPSGAPSFPNKRLFLAIGAALGLMIGVGFAFLLDLLNTGFNSPRQVEEETGLPVLSSIEWADFSDIKSKEGVAVLNYLTEKPLSRFSESIRSLRAGVQMSDVDNPPQVVEVTSASPGEGKTSLSIALAVSAATSGKRVVLIDCDLRRPSVSQQFNLTERPGLVELLAQTASADGILYRDKASGLYVLGSGAKTQSPPDLLGSARMQHLVEQLRQSFDLIVLDAPPIGPVVDASVLAPIADKVVFVVRWSTTAREFVRHSLERIPGDRKICGIAFNMVDLRRTPKYGRYSYYSSAYYKKYYVG